MLNRLKEIIDLGKKYQLSVEQLQESLDVEIRLKQQLKLVSQNLVYYAKLTIYTTLLSG